MRTRPSTELVREGRYLAEVEIELIGDREWSPDASPWEPTISMADAKKLEEVRLALRRGDLKAASTIARVYELKPVAAE